jgi:hypothetical protein
MPMDFPMKSASDAPWSAAPTQLATVVGNLSDHGKALQPWLLKFLRC